MYSFLCFVRSWWPWPFTGKFESVHSWVYEDACGRCNEIPLWRSWDIVFTRMGRTAHKLNASGCHQRGGIKMSQDVKSACGLLPRRCLSVLHQCGCCWLVHMQTGSGKSDAEWILNCCRVRASGRGQCPQRKDQSVIDENKKDGYREEKKIYQGNSPIALQWQQN